MFILIFHSRGGGGDCGWRMPSDKIQLGVGYTSKGSWESQSIWWANHPSPLPEEKVELINLGSMYFIAYDSVCGDALRC